MSNPEQSKHLETARMTVDGLELDLVNLRSETYTDSRIPGDDLWHAPAGCGAARLHHQQPLLTTSTPPR